jgi:hypothetical protein
MEGVSFDIKNAKRFHGLFTIAVIPAYLLSLLEMSFGRVVWVPAAMAALLQILGLLAFYRMMDGSAKPWFSTKNKWVQAFLFVAAGSFFLKYILQFLSVLPSIQVVAFSSRNLIIGYLHLCLLGVITCFFVALFLELKWLELRKATKIGSTLFLTGFLATEALLGVSGMGWGSALLPLLLFSGMMAVGIALLLAKSMR